MELGLLSQDMDPGAIEVKRRVVARPGRKTPMCMVSADDSGGGVEVEFRQLRTGLRNIETIMEIAAIVARHAKRNGQLPTTIGFRPPH